MQKEDLVIKKVSKIESAEFIAKHHYRKIMPRLNKVFYGGYIDNELVALITLGYGTQPLRTIQKIFPSLSTKDYFEVGRMCLVDELKKNSESYFMSRVFKQVKRDYPDIKVIFSWSDGIMGKPGFVYQAVNFFYAGKIKTDIYITKEGYLVHPRSAKALLEINAKEAGKEKLFWLTDEFCRQQGITRLKGFQFKYLLFTCGRLEKKRLMRECTHELSNEYPKMEDIKFFTKQGGKYLESEFPKYKETISSQELKEMCFLDGSMVNIKRANSLI